MTPIVILPSDLEELFVKYASEYSIDKELLKRIAKCESNFNTNAGGDLYAGLFQFAKPIWGQTRTLMEKDIDPNLRFNPEEAIRTAAFMVSQNHLGIWPVCGK
ncbi:MAG: lytic transglycosylase domain-containing protein [Patescibacteria group bacterium]|nr:lytic transglycosylase domain-containing protein [Patescibacteria group bacterium]